MTKITTPKTDAIDAAHVTLHHIDALLDLIEETSINHAGAKDAARIEALAHCGGASLRTALATLEQCTS